MRTLSGSKACVPAETSSQYIREARSLPPIKSSAYSVLGVVLNFPEGSSMFNNEPVHPYVFPIGNLLA
jgi:hypothetical protein